MSNQPVSSSTCSQLSRINSNNVKRLNKFVLTSTRGTNMSRPTSTTTKYYISAIRRRWHCLQGVVRRRPAELNWIYSALLICARIHNAEIFKNKKLSCHREAVRLCLSVVSFNSTIPRAHYSIQIISKLSSVVSRSSISVYQVWLWLIAPKFF